MTNSRQHHFTTFFLALAAMTACFLYLLHRTWLKWGDLLVDTFREFWVPVKLLEGHLLYGEIFYEYGFFPPFLQALLFRIFDPHLYTLAGLGLVITILVAVALYLISRIFTSIFVSALTVLVFFLVFAFAHYFYNNNFNFILPYSFASTLFLLFTLYAVYFFLRFIASGRHRHLLCWALCLIMAIFCRVELPLLTWAGFLVTGLLYAFQTGRKTDIRFWLLLLLPVITGVAGYLLFIFLFHVQQGFTESVLSPFWYLKSDHIQALIMGTHNLMTSLNSIGQSTLLTLAGFSVLALGVAGIARFIQSPGSLSGLLLLLVSLSALLLPFFLAPFFLEKIQYACLSFFLPVGLLYFLCRLSRKTEAIFSLQMFCLFLVALLVAFRVLLKIGPEWYGFYLAVPALICYHLIVFNIFLPFLADRLPGLSRRALEAVFIGFLLFMALGWWNRSEQAYQLRTAEMVTPKGSFYWFNNEQTRQIVRAVSFLREKTPPEATVVVFPEGIAVNILSDRKNPLKYCNFMPPVLQYIGEDVLIRTLAQKKVDYVVLVGRTARDYGYPFFGTHYARKLSDWIENNYRPVRVFGAMPFTTKHFGVAIYRKIKP